MESLRTQYSQEFRDQSVKFFKEGGLTLAEATKRLPLFQGTLKIGFMRQTEGELAAMKKDQKPLIELELELSGVKREGAEVKR